MQFTTENVKEYTEAHIAFLAKWSPFISGVTVAVQTSGEYSWLRVDDDTEVKSFTVLGNGAVRVEYQHGNDLESVLFTAEEMASGDPAQTHNANKVAREMELRAHAEVANRERDILAVRNHMARHGLTIKDIA